MKPSEVTTLHLTWILRCFMISIFAIIMVGCSNSKSQNGNSSQSEEEQTFEDRTNTVHPVIVCNDYDKHNIYRYSIAFKSNGEYITFDNDADYQTWCAQMAFLKQVVRKIVWAEDDFGYKDDREWCNSAEFDSLLENLPELVNLYLSGKKNDIQDKRVFKRIDTSWYDFHPDRMNFTLSNDGYGYKRYTDVNGSECKFYSMESYNITSSYLKDLKGDEVPLDALIFD